MSFQSFGKKINILIKFLTIAFFSSIIFVILYQGIKKSIPENKCTERMKKSPSFVKEIIKDNIGLDLFLIDSMNPLEKGFEKDSEYQIEKTLECKNKFNRDNELFCHNKKSMKDKEVENCRKDVDTKWQNCSEKIKDSRKQLEECHLKYPVKRDKNTIYLPEECNTQQINHSNNMNTGCVLQWNKEDKSCLDIANEAYDKCKENICKNENSNTVYKKGNIFLIKNDTNQGRTGEQWLDMAKRKNWETIEVYEIVKSLSDTFQESLIYYKIEEKLGQRDIDNSYLKIIEQRIISKENVIDYHFYIDEVSFYFNVKIDNVGKKIYYYLGKTTFLPDCLKEIRDAKEGKNNFEKQIDKINIPQ